MSYDWCQEKPVGLNLLLIKSTEQKFQLAMKVDGCRISIGTFQLNNIGHGLKVGNNREFWWQALYKAYSEFKVYRKYFIRFTSLLILAQQARVTCNALPGYFTWPSNEPLTGMAQACVFLQLVTQDQHHVIVLHKYFKFLRLDLEAKQGNQC